MKHSDNDLKGPCNENDIARNENDMVIKKKGVFDITEPKPENTCLKGPCHKNDKFNGLDLSHGDNEVKRKAKLKLQEDNKKSELEVVFDKIKRSKSVKMALKISPKKSKLVKNVKNFDSPKSDRNPRNNTPRSINEVLRSNKKDSSIKKKDRNRVRMLVRRFDDDPTLKNSPQAKLKIDRKGIKGISTRKEIINIQSKICLLYTSDAADE